MNVPETLFARALVVSIAVLSFVWATTDWAV
jgi:hypothetical protein